MRQRKDGIETRKRLLEAAGEIFGAKNYREATVEEICKRAETNLASVNYHFGDKETLYKKTWRQAHEYFSQKYPPDGGLAAEAAPEVRLHGRILALMRRILDPNNCEFDILRMELANPTGLLAEVMHESIEPLQQQLSLLIRELLGEKASEEDVWLAAMSIRSMCFNPAQRIRRNRTAPRTNRKRALDEISIETLAKHITQFSLGGLREIRCRLEHHTESNGAATPASMAEVRNAD